MRFALIYITHPSEEKAREIGNHLVEKRLAACANIFPISSAYWWQGAIQQEGEWVSIVKTTLPLWEKLKEEVRKIHPYEVPCIVKVEAEANEEYYGWIESEVRELKSF
ncbi:MAG: divalent-cation tolerance protein CutA [Saprospirales bacterium]|nr:divalent-cation tolerance protein CutA [Saprospirales bacterium]